MLLITPTLLYLRNPQALHNNVKPRFRGQGPLFSRRNPWITEVDDDGSALDALVIQQHELFGRLVTAGVPRKASPVRCMAVSNAQLGLKDSQLRKPTLALQ